MRQCDRDARRSRTGISDVGPRPMMIASLSTSRTVRRWFSSRMKRGTADRAPKASAAAHRWERGGSYGKPCETARRIRAISGRVVVWARDARPWIAAGLRGVGARPCRRREPGHRVPRLGGSTPNSSHGVCRRTLLGDAWRRVGPFMGKAYTVAELADMAGVSRDTV